VNLEGSARWAPHIKEICRSLFEGLVEVDVENWGDPERAQEYHCKFRHLPLFNIKEEFFLHFCMLSECLWVFFHMLHLCVVIMQLQGFVSFQVKVFEASHQEGVKERYGFWETCTKDAFLNSAVSDEGVLRHRTEIINSEEEDLMVVEYLWGKAVWE